MVKCCVEQLRPASDREERLEHLGEGEPEVPWTFPRITQELGGNEYEDVSMEVPEQEDWEAAPWPKIQCWWNHQPNHQRSPLEPVAHPLHTVHTSQIHNVKHGGTSWKSHYEKQLKVLVFGNNNMQRPPLRYLCQNPSGGSEKAVVDFESSFVAPELKPDRSQAIGMRWLLTWGLKEDGERKAAKDVPYCRVIKTHPMNIGLQLQQ